MNDDLQKEIDGQLKKGEKKQPEAFKKSDIDDILLKPKTPIVSAALTKKSLADTAKELEHRAKEDVENSVHPPRSIADLLKLENSVVQNPPKSGPSVGIPELAKNLKADLEKPTPTPPPIELKVELPSNPKAEEEPVKTFNVDTASKENPVQLQGLSEFPPLKKDNVPKGVADKLNQNLRKIDYSPKTESTVVKKLRTLKGDIEEAMRSGKTSLISIAAAEQNRRAEIKSQLEEAAPRRPLFEPSSAPIQMPSADTPESESFAPTTLSPLTVAPPPIRPLNPLPPLKRSSSGIGMKIFAIFLSIILIGGGAGAFYYLKIYQREPVIVTREELVLTPFIPIQSETRINTDGHNASYIRASFDAERKRNKGSLNEMASVYFSTVMGQEEKSLTKDEFFNAVEMRPPEGLNRSLLPNYMIGIHHFTTNQTFMIFETDTYETAVAGMLEWESKLEDEVGKFLRSPNDFAYPLGTSGTVTPRSFTDKIFKNIDTRVMYGEKNNLLFLYAFINRKYLVITTDPDTLAEIVSGLSARTVSR